MRSVAVALCALALAGCAEKVECVESYSVGRVVDMDIKPGGFMTSTFFVVKTERRVFFLYFQSGLQIGEEAWVCVDGDGLEYLSLGGGRLHRLGTYRNRKKKRAPVPVEENGS